MWIEAYYEYEVVPEQNIDYVQAKPAISEMIRDLHMCVRYKFSCSLYSFLR